VRKAVKSLTTLGNDFKVINTGNKHVICSVSVELNQDHMNLLKSAESKGGMITVSTSGYE
jgi:hypothetical protein